MKIIKEKYMTDNFTSFRSFMRLPETEGGDAYYVIELVRRGKDHPDLPAANYHFKNYYIDTLAKYDKVKDEIRLLCRTLRLRAYVSVNRKSFRRVTLGTIAEMSRRASLDDYRRPYAVFDSVSGKDVGKDDKHWIVDIDDCMFNTRESVQKRADIIRVISECEPEGSKLGMMLPTRTGTHIISRPFNLEQFVRLCSEDSKVAEVPDIKKNHLTLLFEDL